MHSLLFPMASLLTVSSATLERQSSGVTVALAESPASAEERMLYECGAGTIRLTIQSASPEPVTIVSAAPQGECEELTLGQQRVLSARVDRTDHSARWEVRHRIGASWATCKTIEVHFNPAKMLARL